MPEGPLGFKRLTSLGPFVSEDKEPEEKLREIDLRSHSYRGYSPDEFIKLLNTDSIPKSDIRTELKVIESNRFYDMLKEIYNFYIPLDPDERRIFEERNPGVMEWLEVYARAEDLRTPSESK